LTWLEDDSGIISSPTDKAVLGTPATWLVMPLTVSPGDLMT
jgi:hypothetical protein